MLSLLHPNHPDWSILWAKAAPVTDIPTQVLTRLPEMCEVMIRYRGIGLAAPQVGLSLRFFITRLPDPRLALVINPEITYRSTDCASAQEGCLSWYPWNGDRSKANVCRANTIDVRFVNAEGKTVKTKGLNDMDARVFQHEYDHLDGICIFPNPKALSA